MRVSREPRVAVFSTPPSPPCTTLRSHPLACLFISALLARSYRDEYPPIGITRGDGASKRERKHGDAIASRKAKLPRMDLRGFPEERQVDGGYFASEWYTAEGACGHRRHLLAPINPLTNSAILNTSENRENFLFSTLWEGLYYLYYFICRICLVGPARFLFFISSWQ